MGKKKPMPLIEDVQFTAIGAEGNAIARVGEMVLFVPMLIPGDVADIRVRKKKKRYMEGDVVRLKQLSPDRIEASCRHFGVCGGCKWQHMPYELQLKWKAQQVFDNLTRIGKVELQAPPEISAASETYFYRNKLEFTFSSKRWLTRDEISSGIDYSGSGALGFHIPGYFDKVLEISECLLQPEPSNTIRNILREFVMKEGISFFDPVGQTGQLRNIIVRTTVAGQLMIIVVFREDNESVTKVMEFLKGEFPAITSLMYIINEKRNDSVTDREVHLFSGADHIVEELEGLRFRVGPKSFYQTNPVQAAVLYDVARTFAGLTGSETVYDLYCGTGTIACYLAGSAKKVIGVEYVEEAVVDARLNAELNSIENVSFHAGDMKDVLSPGFFGTHGSPDVIITDPPRAGMHPDVVQSILNAAPGIIVYVSCNPASQARDIQLLSEKYDLTAIRAVDMFPQTHHIENVVRLDLRSSLLP
jgi:23S rRNA (uracil1939-C5)-methyltransferase